MHLHDNNKAPLKDFTLLVFNNKANGNENWNWIGILEDPTFW